jgi:xylan 1,4-beta-xylosidase
VPDGKFSVSDFRVFGKGNGGKPGQVQNLTVLRDSADSRRASISWSEVKGSTGYVVYFGLERGKCFHSVMVYGKHWLQLNALNKGVPYFFRVDAFNENGITKGIEK